MSHFRVVPPGLQPRRIRNRVAGITGDFQKKSPSVSFCLPPAPSPHTLSPRQSLSPRSGRWSDSGQAWVGQGRCLLFPCAGVGLGQVKLQPEFETGVQNFLIHRRNDVGLVAQREQLRDCAYCERLVV